MGDPTAIPDSPARQQWGDFIRVRPYGGEGSLWIGMGYTMNEGIGSTAPIVEEFIFPRYFIFGREIDGAPPREIPVIPD